MALTFEIAKIIGWVVVLYILFRDRLGVPLNTFYLMLLSTLLMIHSGVYDILHGYHSTKSLVWLPANILTMVVYIVGVRRYHLQWHKLQGKIEELDQRLEEDVKTMRDENIKKL